MKRVLVWNCPLSIIMHFGFSRDWFKWILIWKFKHSRCLLFVCFFSILGFLLKSVIFSTDHETLVFLAKQVLHSEISPLFCRVLISPPNHFSFLANVCLHFAPVPCNSIILLFFMQHVPLRIWGILMEWKRFEMDHLSVA